MTMQYTHHGLQEQSKALGSLPWLHIGCTSRGTSCQDVASDDAEGDGEDAECANQNPCGDRGFESNEHCLAADGTTTESGGGGNRMRVPTASKEKATNDLRQSHDGVAAHALQSTVNDSRSSTSNGSDSHDRECQSNASIRHIADAWPNLKPHIREAILTLIDGSLAQQQLAKGDSR
jgi:hypothetical protein